jgi:hypothetical protein
MISADLADAEEQRLRSALLEHCGQDTLALVEWVENMHGRLPIQRRKRKC